MYLGKSVSMTRTDSGIVELVLDTHQSAVNVLNAHLQGELIEAIGILKTAQNVKALLIYSAKPAFVLGADITEFTALFTKSAKEITTSTDQMRLLFLAIESLPYPTLSIVNGMALGGGMELALATDFRIANSAAKLGLPEVTLGICPGWGGTVRLSRLIGAEASLDWMLTGKLNKASVALEQGALDAITEDDSLLIKGRELLCAAMSGELDYQVRRAIKQTAMSDDENTRTAMIELKHKMGQRLDKRYPAAPAILETVTRAMPQGYDQALAMEAVMFGELSSGLVAKNLVGLFLNDQMLKRKTKSWVKQADLVTQAAVLGAGIMGGGIAYQSALNKTPVLMKDIIEESLDLGWSTADGLLDRVVKKGRLDQAGKERVLSHIKPTLDYEHFNKVDYVVEAVVERVDVKSQVLAEVEQKIKTKAVLASNTSTISIDVLAKSLQRPDQFCGMHFFNPVHAMPLVEIIRGSQTSDQTIATTVAYAAAMGKTPIVVRDCPGFLVNRILFPYFNGFNRLVMDGVSFERIDQVMESFGWPMGPAYLADVIGLDTMVHADSVMIGGFPERMGHDDISIIEVLLGQGALGQKNGVGFYEYGKDSDGQRFKKPSNKVAAIIEEQVTRSIDIRDEQIIERMMIPMCLEAARCLEENIVDSATEADMGLILGLGFPRFRGGALRYIDAIGLQRFAGSVIENNSHGPLYQLTEDFKQRVTENRTFY